MSALRPVGALATALFVVTLSTGAAGQGLRPGTAEGAELVKTGWWWAANETPLDETVVAPPQSSPPNVPKGTLPVAAAGGEPEKLSALEFRVEGDPGDLLESARLVLQENTDPGATVNAERAVILACPVTEAFWADGAAGAWKARPAYDCDVASARGERDPAGLWTFDLTTVAASWLLEEDPAPPSVVLVEGVDAVESAAPPESFQVSFDGPAADGIGFAFVTVPTVPVPMPTEPGTAPSGSTGGGSAPVTSGADGAGTSGGGLFGGSLASSGPGASGPLAGTADVAPIDVPAVESAEAAAPAAVAETVPAAAPMAAPPWYSGIPRGGYVLFPLAVGLGYLLMLALGPDAQPAAGPNQHGVGRALERLRTMGAALTAKVNS